MHGSIFARCLLDICLMSAQCSLDHVNGVLRTQRRGMVGWVDFGVGYIPRWFTCLQTVSHPSSNHLIASRPGVESNPWPIDGEFDTLPLRHQATCVWLCGIITLVGYGYIVLFSLLF